MALSAPAQAAEIKCKVPFSFTVNGETLPPGLYTLSTDVAQGRLVVRGPGNGAVSLTHRTESRGNTPPQPVFHQYGDQHVLRQAWMGGKCGRQLPQPREEDELIKAARNGKLASFERVGPRAVADRPDRARQEEPARLALHESAAAPALAIAPARPRP